VGGWGSGAGGLGPRPHPPTPNPQSPIPNPQSPIYLKFNFLLFFNLKIKNY